MVKFFLGLIVGTIFGFLICAVFSINGAEKTRSQSTPPPKEEGDHDA
ncbi:MAG: hypothetical protein IJO59_06165 [Clostridia bacterium]|nr:hypothetical protein [Clostridia bacterium]